ncbi:MAG: type I methionyl aminopeptidase [Mycoplasmoidaceae bacterium]
MIYIKSAFDISNIKEACKIWLWVKAKLLDYIKAGKTLKAIDLYAAELITSKSAICTFKDYQGFGGHICTSVNDVIIHGVPNSYALQEGDMLTLDIGVTFNNYVCDAAFTVIIGKNEEAEKISKVCYQALLEGIKVIKPRNSIGDISHAIETYVNDHGYQVLKDFGGHGCGIKLHEDPIILNYGKKGQGAILKPGMVICLEPMILTDSDQYYIDPKDQWSVKAKNHKLTCHWEHMILVTDDGYEILTLEN